MIEESYFGTDGQLKGRSDLGAAIVRWEYDKLGKITNTILTDDNGNVIE